jgi:hypothetical protein
MRELVDQDERCICGSKLGEDTLVLIESGQMLPLTKDPNFLKFVPDWKLPNHKWPEPGDPTSIVRRLVHFDCFHERFNQKNVTWKISPKPNECHICGLDFHKTKWAHRYTIGDLDHDTFSPDPEFPLRGVVCGFCANALSKDPVEEEDKEQVTLGQLLLF